jgi:hypothetical protein
MGIAEIMFALRDMPLVKYLGNAALNFAIVAIQAALRVVNV